MLAIISTEYNEHSNMGGGGQEMIMRDGYEQSTYGNMIRKPIILNANF